MSKKIATIILTVIFMVIFIFVGIGSCGGVKYLINNRSERSLSNATVYADEIVGGGSTNTVTDYISVTLNKYSFYVDGYRGNGFPSNMFGAEYMVVGDFRFTAVYENGNLQSFYVTTLQLMGYYEAGQYITEDLGYIDTDLTATNLVNIAFVNLYQGVVVPGCLELASEQVIDLKTCGDFVAVNVDLIAGDTLVGSFTMDLIFENDTYTYVVSPFGWRMYGDYEINKLLNRFSYKEVFSLGSGNVAIDTTEYFMKGYDAAYNEFYQSRYDQGYSQGEQRGIEVGYAQGLSEVNEYTFLSLISSAIDVPVKAFIGLTDFEFLGFDMTTFYKAIFGFAIIVIILRVVIP